MIVAAFYTLYNLRKQLISGIGKGFAEALIETTSNPFIGLFVGILATAIILFVAFALGWFTSWLVNRFTRVTQSEIGELDQMAQSLHEAEETRDQAITYLQQREAEMTNQLSQTEAELRAAMDGLREARYEAEQLRTHLERVTSS